MVTKGNIDIYNQSVLECPSLIHLNAPYAWNKIYHRSLFEQTKFLFPKGWIWEDIPTIYPLLAKANKVSKIDEPLIYYVLKRKGIYYSNLFSQATAVIPIITIVE